MWQSIKNLYKSKWFPYFIICIGIALRLRQYLANRSLWLDEAALAINIVNKSFAQLLLPLEYGQCAPVGFFAVERGLVNLFGGSEYILRLFPLVGGILALFLFYLVAKSLLDAKAVPIALTLFAILQPLIYYSSELKQYSTDVTIVLLLLYVFICYLRKKDTNWLHSILLGAVGGISVWFSHPAVFILTGASIVLGIFMLKRREYNKAAYLSAAALIWGLNFIAFYFISAKGLTINDHLTNWWAAGFMPLPPRSLADIMWFFDTFFTMFTNPVGLGLEGLGAVAFLVGGFYLYSEDKEKFYFLLSPILVTLAVSGLKKYPFAERLILFLVPVVVLFIGAGVSEILNCAREHRRSFVGIIFASLLFFHPVAKAGFFFIKPHTRVETAPVIRYLSEKFKPQDTLYLHYGAIKPFRYYSPRYGLDKANYIVGNRFRENWTAYIEELDKLKGNKRVWILFSKIWDGVNEEALFVQHLDHIGKQLDAFKAEGGASVYLYDLSSPKEG